MRAEAFLNEKIAPAWDEGRGGLWDYHKEAHFG